MTIALEAYVGIDVSTDQLDVAVWSEKKCLTVAYSKQGSPSRLRRCVKTRRVPTYRLHIVLRGAWVFIAPQASVSISSPTNPLSICKSLACLPRFPIRLFLAL